jgi:hypothetical protein
MKAAMITAIPALDTGWLSAAVSAGLVGSPGLARAAERPASIAAVVAMLSTATAAIANRTARLPNVPIMSVASGGPATQATETIARVFTTSDGLAPEYLRWPDTVVLCGPKTTLLGWVDMSDAHVAEHANVTRLAVEGRDLRVKWNTTDGCCFDPQDWTARLHWNGNRLRILDARRIH